MLLFEAVVVGLAFLVGTCIVMRCIKFWFPKCLPQVQFVVALFLTGFLLHLLFEVTGVNRWYCKNGAACIKK